MDRWTGTIAYLNTPTVDSRMLLMPQELRTGGLPLPLIVLADSPRPAGYVDSVSVVGNEVRAEGLAEDGLLKPGDRLSVGVDLDEVVPEWSEAGNAQVFTAWRLRAVTAYRGPGEPAWPGAHIRLADS